MLTLESIIHARFQSQMASSRKNVSIICDQALWLYSNLGSQARGNRSTSAWKRFVKQEAITVHFQGVNRYLTKNSFSILRQARGDNAGSNLELLNYLEHNQGCTKESIASHMGTSTKQVAKDILRERKNWTITKKGDHYFTAAYIDDSEKTLEEVIEEILVRYPYLTLSQLEFISGYSKFHLLGPIKQLVKLGKLKRGLTRIDSPDEIFTLLPEPESNSDSTIDEPIVLDKRDPLVELIRLERDFSATTGDYWIFINELPQAEFSLEKIKGTRLNSIKNLQLLSTTCDRQNYS